MKRTTAIFSIFGEVEAIVAQQMVDEGTANKLPFHDLPISARYSRDPLTGKDRQARFAIVLPSNLVNVFERRILELRA